MGTTKRPHVSPGVKLDKVRSSAFNLGSMCRKWYRHSLTIPEQGNEYTSRGTRLHAILSAVFSMGVVRPWMTEEWPALESLMPWLAENGLQPIGRTEVSLRRRVNGVWVHGHADLLYDSPLTVVDWKSGTGIGLVPIEQDLQMMTYAWLWGRRFMPKHNSTWDLQVEVMRVLVDERRIDRWTWDLRDPLIPAAIGELAEEMASPDAAYNVDASGHCKWCFNKKTCPAYLGQARTILGDELVDKIIKVDGLPDIEAVQEAYPAARDVVEMVKNVLPKKKVSPRRKFRPSTVLEEVMVWLGRSSGVVTSMTALVDSMASISMTNVNDWLRDRGYTKEERDEFWREVERNGGLL